MFWVKVVLDWGCIGCDCDQCGDLLTSGHIVYLLLDSEMKIVSKKCPSCFRTSFPEGI